MLNVTSSVPSPRLSEERGAVLEVSFMLGSRVPSEESKMRVSSWVMVSADSLLKVLFRVRLRVSFFRADGSGVQSGVLSRSLAMAVAADFRLLAVASLAQSMMRS